MKIATGISMLCIAMLFSACKKDTSGQQVRLVKDIVIDSNSCVIYFTYDAKYRLSSVTQCDTLETYTYSNDTVIYIKTAGGVLSYKNIYTLNKKGLATGFTKLGGDGSLASYVFSYDVNNHRLSTLDTTHPNTIDNYTIQNDDVVLESSTSSVSGDGVYTINTLFYSDTRNTLSNDNFGLSFLGRSSANFKKEDIYVGATAQYTAIYTYLLDNQNGVSQQTSTMNGVVIDKRHFDYY